MKLPSFMRSDPDTRQAAEAALAQTETRIAELQRERDAKLLGDDYATAVEAIDQEIAALGRAAVVHRERIEAIRRKVRSDERARLEREKAARIADTGKRLANLQAVAERVDKAVAALQSAIHTLDEADATIFGDSWLSARTIGVLTNRAADTRDRLGINEVPRVIGALRRIAMHAPFGIAEEIADRGRRLIEHMEIEPIPEPEIVDDDNQREAAA